MTIGYALVASTTFSFFFYARLIVLFAFLCWDLFSLRPLSIHYITRRVLFSSVQVGWYPRFPSEFSGYLLQLRSENVTRNRIIPWQRVQGASMALTSLKLSPYFAIRIDEDWEAEVLEDDNVVGWHIQEITAPKARGKGLTKGVRNVFYGLLKCRRFVLSALSPRNVQVVMLLWTTGRIRILSWIPAERNVLIE